MRARRTAVAATTAALLVALTTGLLTALPVQPAQAAVPACSRGLVALTFDDGPARAVTPRLVRLLRERRVPATFFMVGSRVRTAPAEARLVARNGFVVANHTWSHPQLTRVGNATIRSELRRTAQELRHHGVAPSRLMRPPYGAIDTRVRSVLRGMGLVPVLWTIDSRDWTPGTSRQVADRVLAGLRPHRTNIVLQHDGVRRSPASVEAVPRIVRVARARGYCFTHLDANGRPAVPVPRLRMSVGGGREAGRVPVRVTLTLDRPTSRVVTVRLTTASGTARGGVDYTSLARTVRFPVGTTRATVSVPVVNDALHEGVERFAGRLTSPSGLRLATVARTATIVSDDPAPPPPTPTPTPAPTPNPPSTTPAG